jgi:hypothetical protein
MATARQQRDICTARSRQCRREDDQLIDCFMQDQAVEKKMAGGTVATEELVKGKEEMIR